VGAGEGVVSGDWNILGDASENALAVVLEGRSLSVQNLTSHIYGTAVGIEDALSE
jgi:hypothetical protein